MADIIVKEPVATSVNDVVTPLYFDRQVIRADDLTLDRQSHDAELERMRRLLHGWGIVSGFAFLNKDDGKGFLHLGKGYGITPNGNEIYLTQSIEIGDLIKSLTECCGPGGLGCDVVDEVERKRIAEDNGKGMTTGWLIARPDHVDGDLRPAVPAGCEHPANALKPARRCEGIRFDIICTLDDPHDRKQKSCEELTDWMCKVPKTGREPLLMPGMEAPQNDFLVIAKLAVNDGVPSITYEDRRTLLPVSLLQDWVSACMCAVKPAPVTTTTTITTTPKPSSTPSASTSGPRVISTTRGIDILDVIDDPVLTVITTTRRPLTTPPRFIEVVEIETPWLAVNNRAIANGVVTGEMVDAGNQEKLIAAGVTSPERLLVADVNEVSLATGIEAPKLEVMKAEIRMNKGLISGPTF